MKKLFLYLLLVIFTLTQVAADNTEHPRKYYFETDYPVCATNGTHWFLFKNECRLVTENEKREKDGSTILNKTDIANCFKRCDQVCTDEYAPICTTSGNTQRTFQNRCQLDLENCRTKADWKILHEGECQVPPPTTTLPPPPTESNTLPPPTEPPIMPTPSPDYDCPQYCTLEYDPICASFGDIDQTFQNLCHLKSDICTTQRDWKIKYNGECDDYAPPCNEACPRIYSPLCATFNGENRTFANECLLDLEICKTKNKWDVLYSGECQEPDPACSTVCPEIYEPVCASLNGKLRTFTNKCFLDAEVCKTKQDWIVEFNRECRSPPVKCPESCPFIYQPICGIFNGVMKTFPNRCTLDMEVCQSGNQWKVLNEGECTPPKPVLPPIAPPQPEILPPPPPSRNCPDVCPALYKPVCAIFKGLKRTFSNTCQLGVTVCKTGEDWKVLFDGTCEDANVGNPEIPVCPAIYEPICASFQGVTRTFSNKCQLDAEMARTGQAWDIVGPGECEAPPPDRPQGPCPRCTDEYKPVCAFSNGEQRTFTNGCQLLGENCYSDRKWVKLYDGACKASDRPRSSPNVCPLYYDPVCAMYNGVKKTFPNECELNNEAYRTNTQWLILNKGECDNCPICSEERDPVCAKFNDQVKTFDNSCKMEYENCKTGSEWKIVSKNACESNSCPQFCPEIYSPVCGMNGNNERRTFGNLCEMNREACNTQTEWRVIAEGECSTESDDCPKSCPTVYSPVCAVYQGVSKTFDNECFLRAEVCQTKKNWLIVRQGACSDQPLPPMKPVAPQLPPPKPATEPVSNTKLLTYLLGRIKQYNAATPSPVAPTRKPCKMAACVDVYQPVCATFKGENVEFTNLCYLENTKCATGEDWEIINYGPCQQPGRVYESSPSGGTPS